MSDKEKRRVLFLCTHNSARSQMAEGILRNLYGDKFEVFSAGTEPSRVNPYAMGAMQEIDIDISENTSKSIEGFQGMNIDYVVTVCDRAKESCPTFPGAKHNIHKGFIDPSKFRGKDEEILLGFRQIRDEIRSWIQKEFENI
ncbi:MAG: arsenate reductase ArsC [Candidatus Dadabacteria bacterium]|nr:arsenate reductase ArsC [Candidatus Dadabacteria bacterium]MCZ6864834.1 arsenate reductase ArsC [Candidatus Dadabacteria bacterium]